MQIAVFWRDARPAGVDLYRDLQTAARYFKEVGLEDVRWFGSVELADVGGGAGVRVHRLIEEDSLSDAYVRDVLARHRHDDLFRGYLWNAEQSMFAIHGALSAEDMENDVRRREVDETLQGNLEALAGEG